MYHTVWSEICQQVTFIMKYHEKPQKKRLQQERKQNKTQN
jgi:hypothetical protein